MAPLRFNLSKSGVGVSAGVKGSRIGMDARGRGYVAGGRAGLYFRQRLSSAPATSEAGLPEVLRPQLPLALAGSLVVLLAMLGLQYQRAVCAVADIACAILSKRMTCSPSAPVFGVYFWPTNYATLSGHGIRGEEDEHYPDAPPNVAGRSGRRGGR